MNDGRGNGGPVTLRGIEHVGVTVPDLDAAIDWFVTVLGCRLVYRHGPYEFPAGTPDTENYFVAHLAADPGLRLEIAMLRCGESSNLELFEVHNLVGGDAEMRRFPALGVSHLNFYVDDMEAAVKRLGEHGVEPLGGIAVTGDVEAGEESTNVHFLTPWGMMLEFTSYPEGRKFEEQTAVRTWLPAGGSVAYT